jgi:hypothetical protein
VDAAEQLTARQVQYLRLILRIAAVGRAPTVANPPVSCGYSLFSVHHSGSNPARTRREARRGSCSGKRNVFRNRGDGGRRVSAPCRRRGECRIDGTGTENALFGISATGTTHPPPAGSATRQRLRSGSPVGEVADLPTLAGRDAHASPLMDTATAALSQTPRWELTELPYRIGGGGRYGSRALGRSALLAPPKTATIPTCR